MMSNGKLCWIILKNKNDSKNYTVCDFFEKSEHNSVYLSQLFLSNDNSYR